MMHASRDNIRVVKEKLEIQLLVCNGAKSPSDHKIDVALVQFPVQCLHMAGHEMKHDARIAPREPLDNGGNEARGQQGAASDPHFARRRIGEKLDVLQGLAQVVEYR